MASRRHIQKGLVVGVALATVAAVAIRKTSQNDQTSQKVQPESAQTGNNDSLAEEASKLADPLTSEPSNLLETIAFIESFSPSLMRRDSRQQGIMTGLAVLSARGVSHVVERVTSVFTSRESSYLRRLLVRSGVIAASETVALRTKDHGEKVWPQLTHSIARVASVASASGLVYDSGKELSKGRPESETRTMRSIIVGSMISSVVLLRSRALLRQRKEAIESDDNDPANNIVPAVGGGLLAVLVGRSIALGYKTTGRYINHWLGPGEIKKAMAKVSNAVLWTSAAAGAYFATIGAIGKANEKREPGYSVRPSKAEVSGSKDSHVDYFKLGAQGRRYVTDVLTPAEINQVMRETGAKQPIRTYVGYNSTRIFPSARAELALMELERTGAFRRKYLLLVSPTGTGWIDNTMIESAELLTRGDIATACIQYGRYPSFLSLQKRELGKRQFQLLLWGVKLKLESLPESRRPKVLVFGESLGAWTASDTIMKMGIEGFDHYGVDRALWVGMPKLAKWAFIEHQLGERGVPPGTAATFDSAEGFDQLTPAQKRKLRAIILNHDNDPIARLHPDLLYKRPSWLDPTRPRGRGVPETAVWQPVLTFLQTAIDAGNAMRVTPGRFRSHGHDYRADMAYFVANTFQLKYTKRQLDDINTALAAYEVERVARIKGE